MSMWHIYRSGVIKSLTHSTIYHGNADCHVSCSGCLWPLRYMHFPSLSLFLLPFYKCHLFPIATLMSFCSHLLLSSFFLSLCLTLKQGNPFLFILFVSANTVAAKKLFYLIGKYNCNFNTRLKFNIAKSYLCESGTKQTESYSIIWFHRKYTVHSNITKTSPFTYYSQCLMVETAF